MHNTPAGLPPLDSASAAHAAAVTRHIREQIERSPQGFMPFDQWMELALYAPGLGYYAVGNTKFGGASLEGDFTTAPELTPLFGRVLARQIGQILKASNSNDVLEFGAGSGALAASVIPALRELGIEPRYHILEVSADLRARQQAKLADLNAQIAWLDTTPEHFRGCVLANEVLDAMPVTLFHWEDEETLIEDGVTLSDDGTADAPFRLAGRPAPDALRRLVSDRMPGFPGYRSEINLRGEAWMKQMGAWLDHGAALLIDYGFPQYEYYHPQRAAGTLMCHFRHQAHDQPLILPGLQDITAHVDFTAMANAAHEGGLELLGYTSQARFLMNAGLPGMLGDLDPSDAQAYGRTVSAVQKLVSESEMGELFKVLAVGRGLEAPLLGFSSGDRRHRL